MAKSKSVDTTQFARADAKELFRLMVEQVEDYAFFLLDLDGNVISWNAGAEKIKGYQAEEVIGRNFSLFFSSEDCDLGNPRKQLTSAIRAGCINGEGWRVRKDGARFWANVNLKALRNEAGNLRGFSKMVRDITAQKQAEDAVFESERRERARLAELVILLDAVPMPILITHDIDSLEIAGNGAAVDLLNQLSNAEASVIAATDVKPRHFRAVKGGRDLDAEELPTQMAARGYSCQELRIHNCL